MQAHPHLAKRGNVYQWRRRSHRQSTGIVDLKLSLGTTDYGVALILSRKISAESDMIMEKVVDQQITSEEARKWLSNVVRLERSKIEKLKLLRRIDSSDPGDDLRHDNATKSAWEHIANQGLHAPLPPSMADSWLLQQNMDIIRADLTSDVRARIIARDFRELTGRKDVSAFEIITLMNLLIDGKAAAWGRHDSSLSPIASLADQICADDPGMMGVEPAMVVPSTPEPASALQHVTLTPQAKLDTPIQPAQHQTENTVQQVEVETDSSIFAIVQRMNALKRAEGIEEKTLRQYESFASLFTLLTGISNLCALRQHNIVSFRADLAKLPKSWGKSPADRTATREELMERHKTLPADKVGLSVGTVNRHLEHLSQIVEWALDEGTKLDPRLNPAKLRKKDDVRDCDKKEAFTETQLLKLFKDPVWTGSKSEHFQTRPGSEIFKNGVYWCPIIGAYTGARREEIAGLSPADIVVTNGITCFSIEDSELRRIKNISSKRLVPIHRRLIELGFLDYVKRMAARGEVELFPCLREPKSGKYGKKLGRRMRQIVDGTLGAEGEGLSFHSLRHYVQNTLENFPDVKEKAVRDILGHEGKDVHEKSYGKPTPVAILQWVVNMLPEVC